MALEVNGKSIATDNEGFLLDPADWDTTVAEKLAEQVGIELDDRAWQVVHMVREHYELNQVVPEARTILKSLRAALGKEQATRKYLYELFPYGYGQQACKIAGMRKPLKLMLDV